MILASQINQNVNCVHLRVVGLHMVLIPLYISQAVYKEHELLLEPEKTKTNNEEQYLGFCNPQHDGL